MASSRCLLRIICFHLSQVGMGKCHRGVIRYLGLGWETSYCTIACSHIPSGRSGFMVWEKYISSHSFYSFLIFITQLFWFFDQLSEFLHQRAARWHLHIICFYNLLLARLSPCDSIYLFDNPWKQDWIGWIVVSHGSAVESITRVVSSMCKSPDLLKAPNRLKTWTAAACPTQQIGVCRDPRTVARSRCSLVGS